MRRTAFPIKDRRTVGYVYGGTKMQRMVEYALLKEQYGCYMCLASPRKNKIVRTALLSLLVNVVVFLRGFVSYEISIFKIYPTSKKLFRKNKKKSNALF